MRKFFLAIFIMFMVNVAAHMSFSMFAYADVFQGGVAKDGILGQSRILDSATNAPISGAKISLPQDNYSTYTDSNGNFVLDANVNGQTVLSVEKAGYKPFSVTINEKSASKPMVLGI